MAFSCSGLRKQRGLVGGPAPSWATDLLRAPGLVGFDPGDRDQRQACVAYFLEQAVQRGLVDDDAVQGGGAIAVGGEGHPVEPGGPAVAEVPLEACLLYT